MHIASELYDYCTKNGYTMRKESLTKNSCNELSKILESGESVQICFMGAHNYSNICKYDGFCLYALTNKRFLIISYSLFSCKKLEFPKEKITKVDCSVDWDVKGLFAKVPIDIEGVGKIVIGMEKMIAKDIAEKLKEILFPVARGSVADELLKLKLLLDSGVLTQNEFEEQKNLLLHQ